MKRLTVRLMHIASNVRSQAHHEVVWDPGQLKKAVTPGDVIMTCRKSGKKHFMALGGLSQIHARINLSLRPPGWACAQLIELSRLMQPRLLIDGTSLPSGILQDFYYPTVSFALGCSNPACVSSSN